ncbi:MFS transporter [Anaerotalea alkaliphila]|uniref:MFS transporter n=1 Tax=Anaerotalea alkaliphila TaxID=2662126 RepID=A0A7X5KND2_9FIRM|nr:MFS transporter [Anaerotalea alkaliphila]NDL66647.1 MFS transporter [Anaerotalea alkaliphila]
MGRSTFFSSLDRDQGYIVGNLFFMYFIQGLFTIMIGSILPMMKEEYGLGYQVGGMMISAHSVGNMAAVLVASFLPAYLGMKNSLLFLNGFAFLGFAMTVLQGNPLWLVAALLFTGFGRGGVTNYNNSIINNLAEGHAGPLNLLHGAFAVGALLSPFLVLGFTGRGGGGWKGAVLVVLVLILVSMATSLFMKLDNRRGKAGMESGGALGFFRERLFWITAGIMFFYLGVEATVMGWLVTYFIDSGTMGNQQAQVLTSVLWSVILLGRLLTAYLSGSRSPRSLILGSSLGIGIFFTSLILSRSLLPMLASTIGLGMCMAGMFPTTVANAGRILKRYPMAMGVFVTITSFGAVLLPALVGIVAEDRGIRPGMSVVFVPVAFLLFFATVNRLLPAEGNDVIKTGGKAVRESE